MSAYQDFIQSMKNNHVPTWEELPDLDLYMDQVIVYLERHLSLFAANKDGDKIITPAMINNYVKLGLIPPPVKKKYSKEHLAYLIIICIQKAILPIPYISQMIKHHDELGQLPTVLNEFSKQQASALKIAAATLEEGIGTETTEDMLAMHLTSLSCSYCLAAENIMAKRMTEEKEKAGKDKESKKDKE